MDGPLVYFMVVSVVECFKFGDIKLCRFLPRSEQIQCKFWYFLIWNNDKLTKNEHIFLKTTSLKYHINKKCSVDNKIELVFVSICFYGFKKKQNSLLKIHHFKRYKILLWTCLFLSKKLFNVVPLAWNFKTDLPWCTCMWFLYVSQDTVCWAGFE